ncbi:hypothetical protein V2G26_007242 [Clonostachys chloroleuca]
MTASPQEHQAEGEATLRVEFRKVFESLCKESQDGKNYQAYAHHLARACWHGSRVVLRQTSAEAEGIFDFIIALHKACDGHWGLLQDHGLTQNEVDMWLEFCGMFLSSLGNYFEDGDRKAVPQISKDSIFKMAEILPKSEMNWLETIELMTADKPTRMGYPAEESQSAYYPGSEICTREEIEAVTKIMSTEKIAPENTRLRKNSAEESFEIIQASAERDDEPRVLGHLAAEDQRQFKVLLRRGDHSQEMTKICAELIKAREVAFTEDQRLAISQLAESFSTGNYQAFLDAQKTWIKDRAPRVEHCMGFLFGYRDPRGVRAEWQAAAGVADRAETEKMGQLVDRSPDIICTLPWAVPGENGGKGPFEPSELDTPDFAIIRVLASVSSTVWEATNITIDHDGKRLGSKNIVYGNRISLNNSPGRPCYYVHPSEAEAYMSCAHIVRFTQTAVHELIGHGTGKLLTETAPGEFNFDHTNPPISPITGYPISTWYKPEETWNSVFGKLAPTVEECRAYLIADYLVDNRAILGMFGYNDNSTPTADDFMYYAYLQIGVEGLQALRSFEPSDMTWGDDHQQALFAILKHLIQDGEGVLSIDHDPKTKTLYVRVDRSKIISCGTPSIGRMLCKIHIWHCTADVDACRPFYDALSVVDGEYETWRQVVVSNPEPKWKFLQPNTFIGENGEIILKEYEPSNAGIIQSFAQRGL